MALRLVNVLIMTIFMAFILAVLSIRYDYMGALACFTAIVAPLDACLAIVLAAVVNKNKAENVKDGEGIRYRQLLNEIGGESHI